MTQESREFLNNNRHHYDLLVNAGYMRHLDYATREGILQVIRREFDGGYLVNQACAECVANMMKFAYTQYDKWLAKQPV
jgi:hypothetical protein